MIPPSYAMDSQIKAQDLASTILSSSSPPQIAAACSAVESYLQKHVPDQTRFFFSIAFPALICKIFGYDDSASQKSPTSTGWVDQIHASGNSDLAGKVFNLLSPSGILLSSIFSVDRHSLVKYIFPVERLPEWIRFVLQNERYCHVLSDLCPLFKGRVKEDSVQGSSQIQLNVFEYYVFWFAYYPACRGNSEGSNEVVVRKNRRFRLESWTSSLPVLANAARGLGQKTECSLYLRLLYAYLRAFVPNYGLNAYQPYRSSLLHYSSGYDGSVLLQAEFLVYTLVHFWLVDNDFSPLPVSTCRSLAVSFPLRAFLGEVAPTAGLGEEVKLLLNYLNCSSVDNKEGPAHAEPRWRSANTLKPRPAVSTFSGGGSVGSWNSVIQRPLYRFVLRSFLFCPMGASIKNASQVFAVWMSYLEPWKINSENFDKFDGRECQYSDRLRNEDSQSQVKSDVNKNISRSMCSYTPPWESYVALNYLFYSSLVVHFLGFAHKFLHANTEMMIQMVLQLLNILTSSNELMDLLKKVDTAYHSKLAGSSSPMFDTSYRSAPSIREQLQDWEDGLCESDADGSFLHENLSSDLRLFSEGEDGGHQLLQLFILRAEHEIRVLCGENLSQNLENLCSLKAHMSCLFGGPVWKPPSLVVSEPMHDQQGRDEVFTPKHPGVGKRTWADVKYKGDWMKRPISDGEVAWLARLLVRLSYWLNEILGLDHQGESSSNPSTSEYFIRLREVLGLDHQGESSSNPSTSESFIEVSSDDAYHVGGPKEALCAVLSSVVFWLVLFGQTVIGLMRKHGLRINLRVLASKKVVMLVTAYVVFSLWRKISGMCSHSLLAFRAYQVPGL